MIPAHERRIMHRNNLGYIQCKHCFIFCLLSSMNSGCSASVLQGNPNRFNPGINFNGIKEASERSKVCFCIKISFVNLLIWSREIHAKDVCIVQIRENGATDLENILQSLGDLWKQRESLSICRSTRFLKAFFFNFLKV